MTEPNGRGRVTPLSRLPWRRAAPRQSTVEDIAARDIAAEEIAAAVVVAPEQNSPVVEEPPPSRWTLAPLRLAALGLALVLVIGIGMAKLLVGGPPSVDQLRAAAGVDTWTTLDIGVKADQPGVAYYDPATKIWSGFDIDIAYMIAEDLGFRQDEVRFYAIESEDRARMQAFRLVRGVQQRVPVKMVVASYSITDLREKEPGVTFSDAYFYTEQSAITRVGHAPVTTKGDLDRMKVCSIAASTTYTPPTAIRRNQIGDCFKLLRSKEVEVVTSDAAILAGYEAKYPAEFTHWDLGLENTEAWGVNVGDNAALKTLVDLTLYRSWKDPHDERWERAYKTNLQTELAAQAGTPIAAAEQPAVPRPDVRELPWEDVLR